MSDDELSVPIGQYIHELEQAVEGERTRNVQLLEALKDARQLLVDLRGDVTALGDEYDRVLAAYKHYRDWAVTAEWMMGVHADAWSWE